MASSRQADLLEPINLAEHLDKVELYLGQVCQIAGISKMQLDYWTNKAQIPTKGQASSASTTSTRVETVMLIKQAKDKGLNLGAAIEAARRFREHERAASAVEPALAASQRLGRLLGRERVHVEPGAELERRPAPSAAAAARCASGRRRAARGSAGAAPSRPRAGGGAPRRRASSAAAEQRARERRRPRARPARPAARRAAGSRTGRAGRARRAPRRRELARRARPSTRRRGSLRRARPSGRAAPRRARRAASGVCGRLAPAARPSLTSAWTYGSPARARRGPQLPRLGDERELRRRRARRSSGRAAASGRRPPAARTAG